MMSRLSQTARKLLPRLGNRGVEKSISPEILEIILGASPGGFCAFYDEEVISSTGFTNLFALEKINRIEDLQMAVSTGDAAALEGLCKRLLEKGKSFQIDVATAEDKERIVRVSGAKVGLSSLDTVLSVFWAEDISDLVKDKKQIEQKHAENIRDLTRYREAANNMIRPSWLRDSNGTMIWQNKAYGSLVKTDESGQSLREFSIAPKDRGRIGTVQDLARKSLDQNKTVSERCHIIVSGQRLYVELSETPLTEAGLTFGTITDLTAEEERVADYERAVTANRALLEQLRAGVVLFDANKQLEFYNSAFASLWSLEDSYLNTQPKLGNLLERLRAARRLPEQADFRKYKQGWLDMFSNLLQPVEDMMHLPDSTALKRSVIPHPLGGLMMIFEDVTSRLEMESSYNTLIAVQRETLDNLAEGVAVFGGDGRLKLCNPAYREMWELQPEDTESGPHISNLASRVKKLFDAGQWEEMRQLLIDHVLGRENNEDVIELADGNIYRSATVPLPDGGTLVSYIDITDSARVESALREKNTALEEAEEIKTDFLANVSYQLRTPLNAMMGFAEILNQEYFGTLNDRQKEYTRDVLEAGGRLSRLVDDVLDLSSIEAGYLDLIMNEFDIYRFMANIADLTSDWALKEKITLKLECPKKIGTLIADEKRVKQALINLIHNSISFTPEKGRITIGAKRLENDIAFTVRDTGIGIADADMGRIFDPFEKISFGQRPVLNDKAATRGPGLGLTLVKNIVDLHDGRIDIESEPDKGTTFTVYIPIDPVFEPML